MDSVSWNYFLTMTIHLKLVWILNKTALYLWSNYINNATTVFNRIGKLITCRKRGMIMNGSTLKIILNWPIQWNWANWQMSIRWKENILKLHYLFGHYGNSIVVNLPNDGWLEYYLNLLSMTNAEQAQTTLNTEVCFRIMVIFQHVRRFHPSYFH